MGALDDLVTLTGSTVTSSQLIATILPHNHPWLAILMTPILTRQWATYLGLRLGY